MDWCTPGYITREDFKKDKFRLRNRKKGAVICEEIGRGEGWSRWSRAMRLKINNEMNASSYRVAKEKRRCEMCGE